MELIEDEGGLGGGWVVRRRNPLPQYTWELRHSRSDDLVLGSGGGGGGEEDSEEDSPDEEGDGFKPSPGIDSGCLSKPTPPPFHQHFLDGSSSSSLPSLLDPPHLLQTPDSTPSQSPSRPRPSSSRRIPPSSSADHHHRPPPLTIYDRVDPEDSIRDIISENDFYRFVLFKKNYDKYVDISRKYEEARSVAYYLEEKYHEIKAERDSLMTLSIDLENRLSKKENELHEKEDELFLQLEKAVRLEEDFEKLRAEKEKILEWKNKLEKEKNEAYRQLKIQSDDSEACRRRLERARNDVARRALELTVERDSLERENTRLKEELQDIERKTREKPRHSRTVGLEKELCDLKLFAKQSATLNSQLKKGMKHFATCRRRKCSVCAYTRATFGEYTSSSRRDHHGGGKLFSCFQGSFADEDKEDCCDPRRVGVRGRRERRGRSEERGGATCGMGESSTPGPSPSIPPLPLPLHNLSYIDDDTCTISSGSSSSGGEEEEEEGYEEVGGRPGSSSSGFRCLSIGGKGVTRRRRKGGGDEEDYEEEEEEEEEGIELYPPTDASSSNTAPHAFSSDSGFSSEICDLTMTPSKSSSLRRGVKWTNSFRKLIRRVSSKRTPLNLEENAS